MCYYVCVADNRQASVCVIYESDYSPSVISMFTVKNQTTIMIYYMYPLLCIITGLEQIVHIFT